MPVKQTDQSTEEKEQEGKDFKSKFDKIGDDLVDGLDLSLDSDKKSKNKESDEEDEEERPKKKKSAKESSDEEESDEEESEESESEEEQDSESEDEEESEDDEEEEDKVPVSKMKKRINAEKTRNKILQARIQELESTNKNQPDSRRAKLEQMSPEQLRSLKVNAKAELRELIRTGEKPDREAQVDELIEEIDEIVRTAPERFQKAQVSEYNKAAQDILQDEKYEDIDFDKHGAQIKKLAGEIYNNPRYSELRSMKTGQATALKLAVDHFAENLKNSRGKQGDLKTKQEVNKLKRKISLDNGTQQGNRMSKADIKAKRAKVKTDPNLANREEFIMDNLLEVDKYLPASLRE